MSSYGIIFACSDYFSVSVRCILGQLNAITSFSRLKIEIYSHKNLSGSGWGLYEPPNFHRCITSAPTKNSKELMYFSNTMVFAFYFCK